MADPTPTPMKWGDIYWRWIRRGVDQNYAAYMADQWEAREKRRRKRKGESQ
jgi:hypothetical protein